MVLCLPHQRHMEVLHHHLFLKHLHYHNNNIKAEVLVVPCPCTMVLFLLRLLWRKVEGAPPTIVVIPNRFYCWAEPKQQ